MKPYNFVMCVPSLLELTDLTVLHADEEPRYGGFFEACVHSASGHASTTVHGRRALHLEGDWCTFDSSPGVQSHPQVACCELRCHPADAALNMEFGVDGVFV